MPIIYDRKFADKLRNPMREFDQANGLPAIRNLREWFSPLLSSGNDPRFTSHPLLRAVFREYNVKLLAERQVGIGKPNKQQFCMWWSIGWQAAFCMFHRSGGNLPFKPEVALQYGRVSF